MTAELHVGDVVTLKSGGPKMTIATIGAFPTIGIEQGAECVWFEKDESKTKVFDLRVLVIWVRTPPMAVRLSRS
jgi:uncharacterized protein YodC (DUF2158 family)